MYKNPNYLIPNILYLNCNSPKFFFFKIKFFIRIIFVDYIIVKSEFAYHITLVHSQFADNESMNIVHEYL